MKWNNGDITFCTEPFSIPSGMACYVLHTYIYVTSYQITSPQLAQDIPPGNAYKEDPVTTSWEIKDELWFGMPLRSTRYLEI